MPSDSLPGKCASSGKIQPSAASCAIRPARGETRRDPRAGERRARVRGGTGRSRAGETRCVCRARPRSESPSLSSSPPGFLGPGFHARGDFRAGKEALAAAAECARGGRLRCKGARARACLVACVLRARTVHELGLAIPRECAEADRLVLLAEEPAARRGLREVERVEANVAGERAVERRRRVRQGDRLDLGTAKVGLLLAEQVRRARAAEHLAPTAVQPRRLGRRLLRRRLLTAERHRGRDVRVRGGREQRENDSDLHGFAAAPHAWGKGARERPGAGQVGAHARRAARGGVASPTLQDRSCAPNSSATYASPLRRPAAHELGPYP